MRLVAFSIVILSGAVAYGLGSIYRYGGDGAEGLGLILIVLGGVLFCGELYLLGFFNELKDAFNGRRAASDSAKTSDPEKSPPGE